MKNMKTVFLERKPETASSEKFGVGQAQKVRNFHRSLPGYEPTRLVELKSLVALLGVRSIEVKDESSRFGLNAFKGLGGSYAVARELGRRLNLKDSELNFNYLSSNKVKERLKGQTLITATDGNHGRGVAWTAQQLGLNCVVLMPKGSAEERLDNIRRLGAQASITDLTYDETVRSAAETAHQNEWILMQDTDWEGYRLIPCEIMQGYTTMALEAAEQMEDRPTHIFLQAGVGAMSGALTGFFADLYGDDLDAPRIIIVEPQAADCIFRTAAADDGELYAVPGELDTIMAGLACGTPCQTGWDQIRAHADCCIAIPESSAADGMRILGNPLAGDPAVISGESGAAGFGCLTDILRQPDLAELKDKLDLDSSSRILCFSTEGATYEKGYRDIVWDGKQFPD